jgi:HSP20 family protein
VGDGRRPLEPVGDTAVRDRRERAASDGHAEDGIGGFFALPSKSVRMSALRDALGDLPDAVFADLLESEDAYLLVVDVPGVTGDTVEATVEKGQIHVEARRQKDVPIEFQYRSEERSLFLDIDLPIPPDATGRDATATVDRGVLELRLPKESATPATTIPVDEPE